MESINKKALSERDICTKHITLAIQKAGWDMHTQLLEEVSFTDGKIFVRGRLTSRGKAKRADFYSICMPLDSPIESNASSECNEFDLFELPTPLIFSSKRQQLS
jgi:hypothetical protein